MIDLVEFLWNLSFSLVSLLVVRSLLAVRKAVTMSMAVSSSSPTPASPPLPWKRFAEAPLLAPKRSKEAPGHRTASHAEEGLVAELHPRRSPPSPWRRELVPAISDVLSAGGHAKDGEDSMQRQKPPVRTEVVDALMAGRAGGEPEVGCRRVRRRPTRIVIPETDVGCGFAEVGKVESDGEFQTEGSCYGVASRRGYRREMEDGYRVITNIKGDAKQAYFGVFDGHGGRAAVDYVSEKLGENIIAAFAQQDQKGNGDPAMAIMEGYLTTDKEFLGQGLGSGVCVATVLLKDGEVHAGNVGDCRVVMSRKGVATALTVDHRPEREDERIRIENSGGYVSCHNGVVRVQGSLAVSRAIGDLHVKDWIISEPETTRLRLTSDCEFLIMASDGLWDKVSNQEAVDVVTSHENLLKSCKKLVDISSSRGSRDDITVMVLDLQRFVQSG